MSLISIFSELPPLVTADETASWSTVLGTSDARNLTPATQNTISSCQKDEQTRKNKNGRKKHRKKPNTNTAFDYRQSILYSLHGRPKFQSFLATNFLQAKMNERDNSRADQTKVSLQQKHKIPGSFQVEKTTPQGHQNPGNLADKSDTQKRLLVNNLKMRDKTSELTFPKVHEERTRVKKVMKNGCLVTVTPNRPKAKEHHDAQKHGATSALTEVNKNKNNELEFNNTETVKDLKSTSCSGIDQSRVRKLLPHENQFTAKQLCINEETSDKEGLKRLETITGGHKPNLTVIISAPKSKEKEMADDIIAPSELRRIGGKLQKSSDCQVHNNITNISNKSKTLNQVNDKDAAAKPKDPLVLKDGCAGRETRLETQTSVLVSNVNKSDKVQIIKETVELKDGEEAHCEIETSTTGLVKTVLENKGSLLGSVAVIISEPGNEEKEKKEENMQVDDQDQVDLEQFSGSDLSLFSQKEMGPNESVLNSKEGNPLKQTLQRKTLIRSETKKSQCKEGSGTDLEIEEALSSHEFDKMPSAGCIKTLKKRKERKLADSELEVDVQESQSKRIRPKKKMKFYLDLEEEWDKSNLKQVEKKKIVQSGKMESSSRKLTSYEDLEEVWDESNENQQEVSPVKDNEIERKKRVQSGKMESSSRKLTSYEDLEDVWGESNENQEKSTHVKDNLNKKKRKSNMQRGKVKHPGGQANLGATNNRVKSAKNQTTTTMDYPENNEQQFSGHNLRKRKSQRLSYNEEDLMRKNVNTGQQKTARTEEKSTCEMPQRRTRNIGSRSSLLSLVSSDLPDATVTAGEISDVQILKKTRGGKKKRRKQDPTRVRYQKRQEEMTKAREIPKPICTYYMESYCNKGDDCPFRHEGTPVRGRIIGMCKFYSSGVCARENCAFMHDEFPCKFFHMYKSCRLGNSCRFSHKPLTEQTKIALEQSLEIQEQQNYTKTGGEPSETFKDTTQECSNEITDTEDTGIASQEMEMTTLVKNGETFILPKMFKELNS